MVLKQQLKKLFGRTRRSSKWKRRHRAIGLTAAEALEKRLALSINTVVEAGGPAPWVAVVTDYGSDAFFKHVGDSANSLLIANNSSFRGQQVLGNQIDVEQVYSIGNFNGRYDTLYVFEGESVSRTGPIRSATSPSFGNGGDVLFSLPSVYIDGTTGYRASGRLQVDGRNWSIQQVTDFQNNQGEFDFVSGSERVRVTGVANAEDFGGLDDDRDQNDDQRAGIRFRNLVSALSLTAESQVRLDFSYDADISLPRRVNDDDVHVETASAVLPSTAGSISINLFELGDAEQVVPGTTRGTATVSLNGNSRSVTFDVAVDGRVIFNSTSESLYLNDPVFWDSDNDDPEDIDQEQGTQAYLRGSFNYSTGTLVVESNGYVGFEVDSVSTGVYDADKAAATEITLYAGENHRRGFVATLPSPNSSVRIDSPIVSDGDNSRQRVELSATRVEINAAVRTPQGFFVPEEEAALLATTTEELIINNRVSTPQADIILADRSDTSSPDRARLVIAAGGASISGIGDAEDTGGLPLSDRVYVEVEEGDILIDGEINAEQHTYTMHSSAEDDARFKAPYVFQTGSYSGGLGQIRGESVVVSLGNDLFGEYFNTISSSIVSINTEIESLRIRSGSRRGEETGTPFPYSLTVREEDDLTIDAVAASSRKIDISAGGVLDVNGSIRSGGDLSFSADVEFVGSAPIETAFGRIEIESPAVNLRSGVRVLDSIQDERRSDIIIRATESPLLSDPAEEAAQVSATLPGSISIGNRISAVNNIELVAEVGSVMGAGLVTADKLLVTAAENIVLHTAVHQAKAMIESSQLSVAGQSGTIAIYDEDYVYLDVRNARSVVLVANGDDAYLDDPTTEEEEELLSSALIARVADAQVLYASAPNGSIDVDAQRSKNIQIGNLDADVVELIRGVSDVFELDGMLAGGSVNIQCADAETVDVYDAPTALSGSIPARFKTASSLVNFKSFDTNDDGYVDNIRRVDVGWDPGQAGFDQAGLTLKLPVLQAMKIFGVQYLGGYAGNIQELSNEQWMEIPEAEKEAILADWNAVFRESDVVLVKDGAFLDVGLRKDEGLVASHEVNGLYQVAELGYIPVDPDADFLEIIDGVESSVPVNDRALMEVRLVRMQARDESAEMASPHYVEVAGIAGNDVTTWLTVEGFSVTAPDSEAAPDEYTEIAVRAVDAKPGFTAVKAVTTGRLSGSYKTFTELNEAAADNNSVGRITSRLYQGIDKASELFGGVVLEEGDLVLVQFGLDEDQSPASIASAKSNGLYKVVNPGRDHNAFGTNGRQWVLERYKGVDENGDGILDSVFTGVAAVNQGWLRTSLTGKMFQYDYDGLNKGDVSYKEMAVAPPDGPQTQDGLVAGVYETIVSTGLIGGRIELVVTAAFGGNRDAGTMGRMLTLMQNNNLTRDRAMVLSFDVAAIRANAGDSTAVVSLSDSLPVVNRSIVINGNGVVIDGSGIQFDAQGQELRSSVFGRYFGPVYPSESSLARRVLRRQASDGTGGANGLVFGKASDGSVVRNFVVGGFENGSAVLVDGVDNVLLEGITVGADAGRFAQLGKRLANYKGVEVTSVGKTGFGVTLNDVSIFDSVDAGLDLGKGTQGVRVVDSTIGAEDFQNGVGVRVGELAVVDPGNPENFLPRKQSLAHHVFGVTNASPLSRLVASDAEVLAVGEPDAEAAEVAGGEEVWTVRVPQRLVSAGLEQGLVAYDQERGLVWVVQDVSAGASESENAVVKLLSKEKPEGFSRPEQEPFFVDLEFGIFATAQKGSDVIEFPYGAPDHKNLFLGQEVDFVTPGIFPSGTKLRLFKLQGKAEEVEFDGQTTTLRLSHPVSAIDKIVSGTVAAITAQGEETEIASFELNVEDGDFTAVMSDFGVDEEYEIDDIRLEASDLIISWGGPSELPGSVVMSVEYETRAVDRRLELTERAVEDARSFVIFGEFGDRNNVAYNDVGMVLNGSPIRLVNTDVQESVGVGIDIVNVELWDDDVPQDEKAEPILQIGGAGGSGDVDWEEPREENVAVFANRGAGVRIGGDVFESLGRELFGNWGEEDFAFSDDEGQKMRQEFGKRVLVSGNYLGANTDKDEELANGSGVVRNFVPASMTGDQLKAANALFSGLNQDNTTRDLGHPIDWIKQEATDLGSSVRTVVKIIPDVVPQAGPDVVGEAVVLGSVAGEIKNGDVVVASFTVTRSGGLSFIRSAADSVVGISDIIFSKDKGELTVTWEEPPGENTVSWQYVKERSLKGEAIEFESGGIETTVKLASAPIVTNTFKATVSVGTRIYDVTVDGRGDLQFTSQGSGAVLAETRCSFDPLTGELTLRWDREPVGTIKIDLEYLPDVLPRYRAIFRPEDFRESEKPKQKKIFPELGTLDPSDDRDNAKMAGLFAIENLDRQDNYYGQIPKYDAPNNDPDDPIGDDPGPGPGSGSGDRNDWWNDFPDDMRS